MNPWLIMNLDNDKYVYPQYGIHVLIHVYHHLDIGMVVKAMVSYRDPRWQPV